MFNGCHLVETPGLCCRRNPSSTCFQQAPLCAVTCMPCSHVHTPSLTSLHKVMPTVGLQPLIHTRTQRTHITHWHQVTGSLMEKGHSSLATILAALHSLGAAILTPRNSSQSPGLVPGGPSQVSLAGLWLAECAQGMSPTNPQTNYGEDLSWTREPDYWAGLGTVLAVASLTQ